MYGVRYIIKSGQNVKIRSMGILTPAQAVAKRQLVSEMRLSLRERGQIVHKPGIDEAALRSVKGLHNGGWHAWGEGDCGDAIVILSRGDSRQPI